MYTQHADDPAAFRFNNRYYSILVDKSLNWTQVDNAPRIGFPEPRFQWEGFNTSGQMVT